MHWQNEAKDRHCEGAKQSGGKPDPVEEEGGQRCPDGGGVRIRIPCC